MCIPCLGIVDFDFSFYNELTKQQETISLSATIIENDFDIIVGRRDAFRHDLFMKAYKQIFADLLPSRSDDLTLTGKALQASRLLTISSHGVSKVEKQSLWDAYIPFVERIRSEMRLHPEIERLNVTTTNI